MSYVNETLISGENITYRARLHWTVLWWPGVATAVLGGLGLWALTAAIARGRSSTAEAKPLVLLGLLALVAAAVIFTVAVLLRSAAEYAVTDKRVILKDGVVRRRTVELFLNKVESVGVEQSVAGRLLDFGTITLRGTGGTAESFARVGGPLEFRRQIHDQIARYSEKTSSAGAGG